MDLYIEEEFCAINKTHWSVGIYVDFLKIALVDLSFANPPEDHFRIGSLIVISNPVTCPHTLNYGGNSGRVYNIVLTLSKVIVTRLSKTDAAKLSATTYDR